MTGRREVSAQPRKHSIRQRLWGLPPSAANRGQTRHEHCFHSQFPHKDRTWCPHRPRQIKTFDTKKLTGSVPIRIVNVQQTSQALISCKKNFNIKFLKPFNLHFKSHTTWNFIDHTLLCIRVTLWKNTAD